MRRKITAADRARKKIEGADLARRITYWTDFHELSQVELARRLRVTPSNITAWVRGRAFPSYLILMRLARTLGTNPGIFFSHPST